MAEPLKRGDRVRATINGREGICDNDERGGFVGVRWDGSRSVLFNRRDALELVARG